MPAKSKKQSVWNLGINPKSSMSYEKYVKANLEIISKNLSVRVYKLAPKDEYPAFERGKDLRVGFFWKGNPLMDSTRKPDRKHEILVEQAFWYQSNRNKEDREYMRQVAEVNLKPIWDAHEKAKKLHEEKSNKPKRSRKKKAKKVSAGSTQTLFEKAKKDATN